MRRKLALTIAVAAFATIHCGPSSSAAQDSLGTAENFAVLGGSTVTNTNPTTVTGDLGVSPGSAVTGFPPGIVIGVIHADDAVAAQAQADATTAYNTFAGMACDFDLTGQDLGGLTLVPGVYCFSSSAQLTGALTLDALGSSTAEFIFQIGSTLTTASFSSVTVTNGGNECNVFWQIGSSATLGTSTVFAGNILASADITLTTSATVSGRAIALNGAVTMDTNAVTIADCCDVEASWNTYGQGFAGSAGIPTLIPRTDPEFGTTLTIDISNSAGQDTIGVLFVGFTKADLPTSKGGHVLLIPSLVFFFGIPTSGTTATGDIPANDDDNLCGLSVFLQVIECDDLTHVAGFSAGLELILGS